MPEINDKKSRYHTSFSNVKKCFAYIGLDGIKPQKDAKTFVKKHWQLVFLFILMQPVAIGEFIFFLTGLKRHKELSVIVTSAACSMTCFLTNIKVLALIVNCGRVNNLIVQLTRLWPEEPHSQLIKDIVEKPTATLEILIKLLICLYVCLVSMFHILPIIVIIHEYVQRNPFEYLYPYPVSYPFNVTNVYIYAVVYIHQMFCGYYAAFGISAGDSFMCFCLTNISIQLKILGSDIKNIVENHHKKYTNKDEHPNEEAMGNSKPYEQDDYVIPNEKELYSTLCSYIQRHNDLISLVGDLEAIFSLTILLNFLSSSILICLIVFQVVNTKNRSTEMLFEFALSIPTKILQILLMCMYGHQLITSSLEVAESAYSCKWYFSNMQCRSSIMYIIRRAQKPVYLTAFGFSVVSLESFGSVMGASWSYFTLLKTTVEK